MELSNFFKLLRRHRLTLVIVPVIAVVITYFLVRNQADVYNSQAQIATGIVDQTQQTVTNSDGTSNTIQESQITQEFSNLVEILKSKKMLDQVGYQLMLHDLKSETPYRKPSKLLKQLNEDARDHAVDVYTDFYNRREALSLFSSDQNGLHEVLTSMHYDTESLLKKLNVYRAETSDFIDVEYESENPQLSAAVVNLLCKEFISYYTSLVKGNQHKAVDFLGQLLRNKQDTLNKRLETLKDYRIRNKVLNLDEEARGLYAQISDFEGRRAQAQKDAISSDAAIHTIDKQFNPTDRRYVESSLVHINNKIINTRAQLQALNDQYVQSGFDEVYKPRIDSLNRLISEQINQSADKYIVNPLNTKGALIQQKLTLQVQHDLAKNSIGTMNAMLNRLSNKINALVPHQAVVQADESAVSIASQEYLEILRKYNQSSLEANFAVQLKQIDTAMPGPAQPSKKMLLVILSGFISFVFCLLVLFAMFFLDNTIISPKALANVSKISVLGYLHELSGSSVDLRQVWNDTTTNSEMRMFRTLLQSIRFEVDSLMAGKKILLINSLSQAEGKTFLAMNLAYAYSLINKRVLLIDGNFENAGITDASKARMYIEDYLRNLVPDTSLNTASKITVLGNKGGDFSLLEVSNEKCIKEKMERLKESFDIILIESSALNTLNKSKEWTLFADKIITVFKAGNGIKDGQRPNLGYLKSLNKRFLGWIINEVEPDQVIADVRA